MWMAMMILGRVRPLLFIISQLSFMLLEFLSLLIRQILVLQLCLHIDQLLLSRFARSLTGDCLVCNIVSKYS